MHRGEEQWRRSAKGRRHTTDGAAKGLVVERDYTLISPPQPTKAAGRIEVLGFVWFGCPHGADMPPRLQSGSSPLPAEVTFSTQPAVFRKSLVPGGAQETLAVVDRLIMKVRAERAARR